MKSLQVRDVPDHIYQKLLNESKKEHRSLAQQTIASLAKGLDTVLSPKEKRKELLRSIKQAKPDQDSNTFTDPVDLIREDRDR
ncbi:MAG: hypothetical protein GY786_24280 [Proteobacteria bacterium]|nr:hypothetical protein [Pseudomonadota bacterium]